MTPPPGSSEAAEFYAALEALHTFALWTAPEAPREPRPTEVPHVWRWQDVSPQLMRAADMMDLSQDAQRRVIGFRNPGNRYPGTTHTLNVALQLVLPGEVAPAHRHTMAAIRFVIDADGSNGYTVVDGEQVPMHNGDLILTPGWTWHDHKNASPDRPLIWLDGLDVPFVRALRTVFYEDYPGEVAQPLTGRTASNAASSRLYPWDAAYAGLKQLEAAGAWDPYDALHREYLNPLTGGHVLPTMACSLQLLPAGARTRAVRRTSSSVSFVVRGSGYSVLNGQRLAWSERDTIAVPVWAWQEHAADPGQEAVLFTLSDRPILEPFGLFRQSVYEDNGGFQRQRETRG